MKYYLLIIFSLFSTNLYSANTESFEISISTVNSKSHELIYDPYSDKKLSELIWKAENVKLLGFKYKHTLSSLEYLTLNYQKNIDDGNSVMNDYDWLKDYTSEWSDWSNHPDTKLDRLTLLDFSYTKYLISNSDIKKYITLGYKIENKKFRAYNGTYIYSSTSGFRDLSGSFSGLGITYEETFKVIYAAVELSKNYERFIFRGKLTYSPKVEATNSDTHHARYFTNNNKFNNTTMLGFDLGVDYKFAQDLLLSAGYSVVNYKKTDGTTTRTYYDGATEEIPGTAYVYGGAGISNSYSSINFTIIKKF